MFRHKNQTYYFRILIPTDLRQWFSNREDYAQSLKTKSKAEASRAHAHIEELWQSAFFQIRYKLIEPDKMVELANSLFRRSKRDLPAYKPTAIRAPSLTTESLPQSNSVSLPASMTLEQLIEIYSAEHLTIWTRKTVLEFVGIFRLLVRIIGNAHVSKLDRKQCIALRDTGRCQESCRFRRSN